MRRILLETFLCFVALTALLLVVFGQAVFELAAGGTPGMFDIKHYFVPMSFVLDTALASGELPLWNPLTFCGAPFAANPQSATFYPPNFLRSLMTPSPSPLNAYYGLIILAMLQTAAAGVGVYWLARSHRLGYAASFGAAATFIFSVAYTFRLAELHFIPALVWVPFTMLAFRQLLRATNRSRRMFWAAGCGMMIGWSFLSGFLQLQVYVAVLFVSYWLFDRLFLTRWKNYDARTPIAARVGEDMLYGVCIVLIACAIASALLIPGAEFAQLTYRSGAGQGSLAHPNLSWAEIREGLFGTGDASNVSPYSASMLSAYLLGFIGLLGARRREAFVYALLFMVLFDCSIGPPLPIASLVEAISPFQIAQPQRAFILCCLPLGIAVGFGIQSISDRSKSVSKRTIRSLVIVATCAVLLYLSNLPIGNNVAALFAALGIVAVFGVWYPFGRIGMPLACGVLLAEAVITNHRLLPKLFERSGSIDVRSLSNESRKLWSSNTRSTDLAPNRHLYTLQPAINGYDPLYLGSVWHLLAPWYYNWNYKRILQAHETVRDNPYPFLFVKRPFWLVRQYVDGPLPDGDPLFPPTTTAFVDTGAALSIPRVQAEDVIGEGVSGYESISLGRPIPIEVVPFAGGSQSPAWKLALSNYDRRHTVLRLALDAMCSGTLRVLVNDSKWVDRLPVYLATIDDEHLGPSQLDVPLPGIEISTIHLVWDAKSEACPLELGDAFLLLDGEDEDALIQIDARTYNTIRVTVKELPASRLLAFMDADYPGWSVQVDGKPQRLLKVNNAFKGVELDAGAHTVEFQFQSATVNLGMAISGSCVGVILLSLIAAIARRPHRPHQLN